MAKHAVHWAVDQVSLQALWTRFPWRWIPRGGGVPGGGSPVEVVSLEDPLEGNLQAAVDQVSLQECVRTRAWAGTGWVGTGSRHVLRTLVATWSRRCKGRQGV
jgi:hypothetical protein